MINLVVRRNEVVVRRLWVLLGAGFCLFFGGASQARPVLDKDFQRIRLVNPYQFGTFTLASKAGETTSEISHSETAADPSKAATQKAEGESRTGESLTWAQGWGEHYKLVFGRLVNPTGLKILGYGAAITVASFAVDHQITNQVKEGKLKMSEDLTRFGNRWGAGLYTSVLALLQTVVDPQNGFAHWEAYGFAQLTSAILKNTVRRDRPNLRNDLSFPSGHSGTATVTAAAFWYAYGWKWGLPLSILALNASAARITGGVHYTSDVLWGIVNGLAWAHATHAGDDSDLRLYFDLSRGVVGWEYHF